MDDLFFYFYFFLYYYFVFVLFSFIFTVPIKATIRGALAHPVSPVEPHVDTDIECLGTPAAMVSLGTTPH